MLFRPLDILLSLILLVLLQDPIVFVVTLQSSLFEPSLEELLEIGVIRHTLEFEASHVFEVLQHLFWSSSTQVFGGNLVLHFLDFIILLFLSFGLESLPGQMPI